MLFEFGSYRLDIDIDRTKAYYESVPGVSCECAGCRNYEKAAYALPEAVQQFVRQFGIDIGKPEEISAVHSDDGNMTLYDGFYHICGTILDGSNPWVQIGENHYHLDERYAIKIADDFSVFFTEECLLLDENFPAPAIQMEVFCSVPWVLKEPNPYKRN